jgi:DNA-binding NarL/FixJ family response regulator
LDQKRGPGKPPNIELSPRKQEVLRLVSEGKSVKEIAHILSISNKTVEFHKAAIMDQLGLRTTAELTRYAIENGIART